MKERNEGRKKKPASVHTWWVGRNDSVTFLGCTVCTSGFQCDGTRCIPVDWRCDGHLDCADHSDETECGECTVSSSSSSSSSINSTKIMKKPILAMNTISKSALHCGERRCMSASHICNGEMDCPWGQDERYCRKWRILIVNQGRFFV